MPVAMPAEPRAIVVMGVAGSGKTAVAQALAARLGHGFLDADDFHSAAAKARMAAGVPVDDIERDPWVEALACALRQRAEADGTTVLAFSGLRARHRQRLRDTGLPMRFVFLHAPPHVIAGRLALRRNHFMSPALLSSQLEALEVPDGEPDVVAVPVDRPLAEVVDVVEAAIR